MNTDHNPTIGSKYSVAGLPTIVFLDSSGNEIHRFSGYRDYNAVMKEVEIAKSKLE